MMERIFSLSGLMSRCFIHSAVSETLSFSNSYTTEYLGSPLTALQRLARMHPGTFS